MIKEKIIENIGIIYLDRPEQLNALNIQMFDTIKSILTKWENDDRVKAVLFDSLSEKGFCAGGDIKEIYNNYLINDDCTQKDGLFRKEFELDKYVMTYKKPVISHWFGITMGGGIGLTIFSDLIITDETLNWAMPETMLGFNPDVGVGFHISKLPQAIGQYVGLIGASLSASDVIKYSFADVMIDSKDYQKVLDIFFELSKRYEGDQLIEEYKNKLKKFEKAKQESQIDEELENIEKYFSESSFKDLYKNLENNLEDDFAKNIYYELNKRDPLILTLQFEKYFVGKDLSPDQCFDLDLKIIQYAIKTKSINEGIRAKIIDKDNNPNWPVKSIGEVDLSEVNGLLKVKE